MIRRSFLGMLSAGSFAGLFTAGRSAAATTGQRGASATPPGRLDVSVGSLDLNNVELVDAHVHPPRPMTLKQSYDMWNDSFVDAMVPDYDFPGKKELRTKLTTEFVDQIWNLPRQTGYNNYMARTYGVAPTLDGFDSIVSKHIKSDADFTAYIRSILDRECAGNVDLRRRVEALLAAHDADGSLPTVGFASPATRVPEAAAGTVIAGKYKLLALGGNLFSGDQRMTQLPFGAAIMKWQTD